MEKKYLSIAAMAEETGIGKEVLRKWEERYGFPSPDRDEAGARAYPAQQAARLKLIKRLLDGGMRPGRVVPLPEAELATLLVQSRPEGSQPIDPALEERVIQWLQARDPELLRNNLQAELTALGLRRFIVDVVAPLNEAVGNAWADGSISVKDEHLYTEIVQSLVRKALPDSGVAGDAPRVLLTTVSGEAHALGILMAEVLLSLEGAHCISLGPQTPLSEIVAGADAYAADIVALSFSIGFPKKKILPLLRELRALCAPHILLWAGGSGIVGLDTVPRGVLLLPTLDSGVEALQKFRWRRAARGAS